MKSTQPTSVEFGLEGSEMMLNTTVFMEENSPPEISAGNSQERIPDSQETVPNSSQDVVATPPERKPRWGFLCPHQTINGLPLYDFGDYDSYVIGRFSAKDNCVPNKVQLPEFEPRSLHERTSRRHFAIQKFEDGVYFSNRSPKGTFLNYKLVSDFNWHLLDNSAEISPSKTEPLFTYNGFANADVVSDFPKEVTAEFQIGKQLGEGTFGKVFLAHRRIRCPTRDNVLALKVASLHNEGVDPVESRRQAVKEASLLQEINHVNIVRFYDAREVGSNIYIFVEYMAGGELYERLNKPDFYKLNEELTVKVLMYQAASALLYLHSRGIAHRDIKTENILMKTDEPYAILKLADFGMGRVMKRTRMNTFCGTPGYMAPELLRAEEYTFLVDSWSLGVVMYLLVCLHPPFMDGKLQEQQILTGRYYKGGEFLKKTTDVSRDIIENMLEIDPARRYSPFDLLAHEWLDDERVDQILSPLLWNGGRRPPVVVKPAVYAHQEARRREPLTSIQELCQSPMFRFKDAQRSNIQRPERPEGAQLAQPVQKRSRMDVEAHWPEW